MTAEKIKPFSKEWWRKRYSGLPPESEIAWFCAKRYNIARDREQIEAGRQAEQKRIIGIIEELTCTMEFSSGCPDMDYVDSVELIRKIKGE